MGMCMGSICSQLPDGPFCVWGFYPLFKDDMQAYYEMSELNSLDVDTELDLRIANILMESQDGKN